MLGKGQQGVDCAQRFARCSRLGDSLWVRDDRIELCHVLRQKPETRGRTVGTLEKLPRGGKMLRVLKKRVDENVGVEQCRLIRRHRRFLRA